MSQVLVMVGTQKGAFFLWSDAERKDWRVEGPLIKGWEVSNLCVDGRGAPTIYACVGHYVYGPTLQVSRDFGKSWTQLEHGPRYAEDAERKVERIWCVAPGHRDEPEVLYAGVAEAGLFMSRDGGTSWHEVSSLSNHPTRSEWSPGAGGLCCHTIIVDPEDSQRIWIGISAVGVFRSDDGGATWKIKNEGLPIAAESREFDNVGSCVHRMVLSPEDHSVLYQQNHQGVFRSTDGADSWHPIQEGLPSTFGFPMAVHPRDARTLYTLPLESDEYRFFIDGKPAVYRSRDAGDSWQPVSNGLPPGNQYTGVLRHALSTDGLDPCGLYFGTSAGQIFHSRDEGDSWSALPVSLPRIGSVTAMIVED